MTSFTYHSLNYEVLKWSLMMPMYLSFKYTQIKQKAMHSVTLYNRKSSAVVDGASLRLYTCVKLHCLTLTLNWTEFCWIELEPHSHPSRWCYRIRKLLNVVHAASKLLYIVFIKALGWCAHYTEYDMHHKSPLSENNTNQHSNRHILLIILIKDLQLSRTSYLKIEYSGIIVHPCHLHHGQGAPHRGGGEDLVTWHGAEATIGQSRSQGSSRLTGDFCG